MDLIKYDKMESAFMILTQYLNNEVNNNIICEIIIKLMQNYFLKNYENYNCNCFIMDFNNNIHKRLHDIPLKNHIDIIKCNIICKYRNPQQMLQE